MRETSLTVRGRARRLDVLFSTSVPTALEVILFAFVVFVTLVVAVAAAVAV